MSDCKDNGLYHQKLDLLISLQRESNSQQAEIIEQNEEIIEKLTEINLSGRGYDIEN
jgi:hypothetical protein